MVIKVTMKMPLHLVLLLLLLMMMMMMMIFNILLLRKQWNISGVVGGMNLEEAYILEVS